MAIHIIKKPDSSGNKTATAIVNDTATDNTASISCEQGITLASLMGKALPSLRYTVQGMIAAGVSILGGKPKVGKTWLGQHLALEVSRGGMVMGAFKADVGDVLYLALEDTERRLQSRYAKILQDGHPPSNLHLFTNWPRLKDGGEQKLEQWLTDHPDARLVVIDTLEKIRPMGKQGGTQFGKDYEVGTILTKIATKHRVAILLVHHLRKTSATDPLDLLSGTLGLTGGVDGVLILQRNRANDELTLFVTGRDIEEEKNLALSWDLVTGEWSILGDVSAIYQSEERQEIEKYLKGAGCPQTIKEIAEGLGRQLEATRKLVRRMVRDGMLVIQTGFRYELPELESVVGKG